MQNQLLNFVIGALLLLAPAGAGAAIVDPVLDENELEATLELGALSAELSITFENAVGLNMSNLGLSVEPVSLTDLALLSRLIGSRASLVSGFPVLVRVQPPSSGGLAFEGTVEIELYTHDLHYTVGTPLRLFSASNGGAFTDITTAVGSGSYRVRGSKGTFSEFLIVADTRAVSTVIGAKFKHLESLLDFHAASIDNPVFGNLASLLYAAKSSWKNKDTVAAINGIEAFGSAVTAASGEGIPDVWRSSRDIDNVAGELRAAAETLRFSLTLASNAL